MVSKLKWIITHGASFQIRTKWLDSLERLERRVGAHITQCPWWDRSAIKAFSPWSVTSVCDVGTLWRCDGILYSALLSSDLCNTRDISQVGSAEYQVTARDLHQNLTRTSDTDNSNSNNQSPVKISFRLFYLLTLSFVGKIKKNILKKVHGQSLKINSICSLLELLVSLGSQPVLTPSTFLACTCPVSPLVCAAPAACLCLLNNIL